MPTNKIYPGMMCGAYEFFTVESEVKFITSGMVKNFSEITYPIVEVLKAEINKDQSVVDALIQLHPNSEIKQLEQFVSCRFGGLDYNADINDHSVQEGEYWECPMRGSCPHEGILCKMPVYNNHRLDPQQVKLLQLTSTDMTNEVVAEMLNLPMGSLHKAKRILYQILGIQTKQESALIAKELNLI